MKSEITIVAFALLSVAMQKPPITINTNPTKINGIPVGKCIDCHSIQKGTRRAVVGEFNLASHHLQSASLNEKDCRACHDLSQHREGKVRLRNTDTGEIITLTGNPMTDYAQAFLLEPFCLACHDADGANGQPPFSDQIMPQPIDASLFNIGAHKAGGAAGPMTCFGDGETFGCHNTAHGSAKKNILAPYTADQPPVNGDPLRQEEGMCYTCHDADGPSMFDQQSLFNLPSHHHISSIDQQDGSKVECTNCHNPHTANPSMLLADPDSGGKNPWIGTKVDFCITCHDGNPPADISFPANYTGTGYNKSNFIGSTHEANLGAEGCGHCHDEHGSVNQSLLELKFVDTDYNSYSFGDGDYAACWRCHDETSTVFGNNAFSTKHSRHVSSERAACVTCHDVHSAYDPGEPGLINFEFGIFNGFNIAYRAGHEGSDAFYLNGSMTMGYCYINCHGKSHSPKSYTRNKNPMVDCSECH